MARFAYAKSSVPCEHLGDAVGPAAVAAGHAGLGSPMPSVNESPIATYLDHGCCWVTIPPFCTGAGRRGGRCPPAEPHPLGRSTTVRRVSNATPRPAPAGHLGRRASLTVVPEPAAWGTASKLRPWQAEALERYFETEPRDFLAAATPGAGKTAFALRLAAELRARRTIDRITVVAPTDHLKRQWADAAARVGIRLDPGSATRTGARRATSTASP